MKPRWLNLGILILVFNAAYIGAFATPSIFYMGNVLVHLLLGVLVCVGIGWALLKGERSYGFYALLASALPAAWLVVKGNTTDQHAVLVAHVVVAMLAVCLLLMRVRFLPLAAACLILLPASTALYQRTFPNKADRIVNPQMTPISMEEEGDGPKSPFWPSSSRTNTGLIPSSYFMDSEQCGQCHRDIYEQWKSSVHHFASFNNQFYRKSIEYMQDVQGSTKPSRWCASCHDHAVIFNGKWEKPIKEQIDTPEAQAGLACTSCHSISQVHDTMGNSGFTLDYNWLHEIASNKNKYVQAFDYFLTYLNPAPHRKTFLKPFVKDSSEFCASCHKVHLDKPVNNYRWIRGFNDYDNWQASGVSGRGARSFYYPKETSTCSGCHMPLVASKDPGNRDGKIHSHRFPAANTAVPLVNGDKEQLEITKKFLQSGFITVDIFSASPIEDSPHELKMTRRAGEPAQTALTSFAVGEEAESSGPAYLREVGRVAAPLKESGVKFEPGSSVRVDVVVRTKKIGHFFPGGTVDAFDVWLELEGLDAEGKHIFWSGRVDENGRGPVETGAHFYRSYQLDGEGNPINKRNAWQTRSVLYVRLIPPGAADTAHFRVKVPKDAKGPITLRAKLNYRKFAQYYTKFAYAGQPKPDQDPKLVSIHHDSRDYSFEAANIPDNVSGGMKRRIPNLPIVTLAQSEVRVELGKPEWKQTIRKEDFERWNDWGIGMLLQGDLRGAQYAFQKVMEAKPEYADGPLNVARALIQEGETAAARPYLDKTLQLAPDLPRGHFFLAMVEKADGNYEAAALHLLKTLAKHPEDRVVLNQLGRVQFLQRRFVDSVATLKRALMVDPEDLQAHYSLMLAWRGVGNAEQSERHAKLFQRFKADESAQTITQKARLISPEDNNERQMIHDHESVRLP